MEDDDKMDGGMGEVAAEQYQHDGTDEDAEGEEEEEKEKDGGGGRGGGERGRDLQWPDPDAGSAITLPSSWTRMAKEEDRRRDLGR